MKKRTLTPEQTAARDARRAKFRDLWKQVAKMSEAERILIADKLGLRTCDGHQLSPANANLVLFQSPGATVLGGFRQWRKHGRTVSKGQHGIMIWVPCGGKKNDSPLDGSNSNSALVDASPTTEDNDGRFIVGTIFDISQTEELTPGAKFSPDMPADDQPEEQTPAPLPPAAPAFTPDPVPEVQTPAAAPAAPEANRAPQLSLF